MSSKLIKVEGIGYQTLGGNDYYLILDKKIYHTNPLTSGLSGGGKLSLKNCEAIERGYDLDELIKERFGETFWHDGDKYFKEGFQKALEILGDKKEFLDFIRDCAKNWDCDSDAHKYNTTCRSCEAKKLLKSLQQTEWDVDIIEECLDPTCDGINRKGECVTTGKPKLDVDSCLILKRK